MKQGPKQNAFTLIELLASMGVLAILVLICGNVFSSSTRAWNYGSARVEQNGVGRGVMDLLHRQLSDAMTGTNLWFQAVIPSTVPNSLGAWANPYNLPTLPVYDLQFVSANYTGQSQVQPDEMRVVHYFLFETTNGNPPYVHYQLWSQVNYGWVTNSPARVNSYGDDTQRWWYQWAYTPGNTSFGGGSGWVVNASTFATGWTNMAYNNFAADNVTSFAVLCGGPFNSYMTTYNSSTPANNYQLPYYVDVLLGTLSEADARKAAQLVGNPTALTAFIAANEKRFIMRAYCIHRAALMAPRPPDPPSG